MVDINERNPLTPGCHLAWLVFSTITIFLATAFSIPKPPAPPTMQKSKDRAVGVIDLLVGRVLELRKLVDVDAR
jgi:hypothetical protein